MRKPSGRRPVANAAPVFESFVNIKNQFNPRIDQRKESAVESGKRIGILAAVLGIILVGCLREVLPEPSVSRISKEEVKSLLGSPNVIILDVRVPDDWNKSKEKIAGAVREDPAKDIQTWASKYPKDKKLIFYCS
jgi:hypothetical protein